MDAKQRPLLLGMLGCRRVRVMMELLRGIRQIKAYAWEPFFAKQVERHCVGTWWHAVQPPACGETEFGTRFGWG